MLLLFASIRIIMGILHVNSSDRGNRSYKTETRKKQETQFN